MTELRLREYVQVLLRHRLAMVLVTVGVVLLGVVPEALQAPVYAAKAQVRVSPDSSTSPFAGGEVDVRNQAVDLYTEVEVLRSDRLRALVQERLGPGSEPFGRVRATQVPLTTIIQLSVTAASPAAAADAANAYAEVFVEGRREASVSALVEQSDELKRRSESAREELAVVDAQLADPLLAPTTRDGLELARASLVEQIRDYTRRADQLDVEASLREGTTDVVEPATQNLQPISPNPLRTGLVSLVLGLLAAVAVAVALELHQDRVWSPEEIAAIDPELTVLASVPHMDEATPGGDLDQAALEGYRYLRTSLRFAGVGNDLRAVVVTSAQSGEGKTTTTLNLARVMARAKDRVVVIDADIRRPSIHMSLGLPNAVGLTSILGGSSTVEECIHYVEPTLAVITAGPPTANPSELLGSPAFEALVASLRDQCDLLLLDAPPVLPVADPLLVARVVEGALLVARLGQVRRRDLRAVLRRMRDSRLRVLGLVANDLAPRMGYNSYDDYAKPEAPRRGRSRFRRSARRAARSAS